MLKTSVEEKGREELFLHEIRGCCNAWYLYVLERGKIKQKYYLFQGGSLNHPVVSSSLNYRRGKKSEIWERKRRRRKEQIGNEQRNSSSSPPLPPPPPHFALSLEKKPGFGGAGGWMEKQVN